MNIPATRPGCPARYAYRLSEKGMALLPVLQDMCRWANAYVPGTWTPPESFLARRVQPPLRD